MDELLKLEEEFRREGARAGFQKGAAVGKLEGRTAGFVEGASRALERRFAEGVADTLLALGEELPERARVAANELKRLSQLHRMHVVGNVQNRDVEKDREELQHQMRLTLALARMPPIRPRALQRDPGLSF